MTEPLKVSREQMARLRDYAETFSTDSGRRVLEDLEKDCSGGCFVKGDLYETLYWAFRRDWVDDIKNMVKRAKGPLTVEEDE